MLALDSTGSPLSPDSHLSGKESRGADSDLLAVSGEKYDGSIDRDSEESHNIFVIVSCAEN
jgi:hypothetical protein